MLRRIIAAVLCIGVLAGAVATAEAARNYKAGTYRGQTEQGAKISLKVLKNKKALIKFNWEGAVMGCSDGENRQIEGFQTPTSERIKLSRRGKFEFTASANDGSVEFATVGQVKKRTAKGALQVQAATQDEAGNVITCDSEIVEWIAKRRR
jgi:hypothetical protein